MVISQGMDWETELQKLAENKAFFYVTLDPERALGLEDILPNYTIVCPYKSQLTATLKENKVQIVVLEEHLSEAELRAVVSKGTYGILSACGRSPEGRQHKLIGKNDYAMVMKNSALIEDFCKKQGWKLLAPKAKVAEKFENKISQYKLLKDAVAYPQSYITNLEKLIGTVRDKIFVLQFNRGHSGNSTYFIKSEKDLEKLYKLYPKRECKISEYIKGKTYTLNCLALKNGEVIIGSLSEQITGLKAATNNPNTTCGNDFTSLKRLSLPQIKAIQGITRDISKVLHRNGYRGLFGIDVIIASENKKVYFIELNTHQPASISFEAKLHRKIGKMPLLAYFISEFISPTRPSFAKATEGKAPIILPIAAKQIIYRNKTSKILTREDIEKKYKGKGLLARAKYIKPNEEIYRIQHG